MNRDVTLEQWVAVSDELAALVRAGIPLAPSLSSVGADIPGRLGDLVGRLGQRLEQGQSLGEALAAEPGRFPPVLSAVVQSGIRSGRLPAALESLAESAKHLSDIRQTVYAALLYPIFVVTFGYGLFIVFLCTTLPRLKAAFAAFRLPTNWGLETLSMLGETVRYWGAVPPIVVVVVLVLSLRSRRPRILGAPVGWPFGLLPGVRPLASGSSLAVFAELMALLLEQQAPLPESLRLAAQSTADRKLLRSADRLAAGIERGEDPTVLFHECTDFSPLVRCLLLSNRTSGRAESFKQAARLYRDRLAWRADRLRLVLPTSLVVFLGGGMTALMAVAIIGPFLGLLKELTLP